MELNPYLLNTAWKILIADDSEEFHCLIRTLLDGYKFEEKGIEFVSAYSSKETKQSLLEYQDIALIFLDMIMENKNAGCEIVKFIREEMKNNIIQIVLCTGHFDQSFEREVIEKHSINFYRSKTELTSRLIPTVVAALRAYQYAYSYLCLSRQLEKELCERMQTEEKFRLLKDELEQRVIERTAAYEAANRAKNQFLANVSHELRTPMNAVIGTLDLVLDTELNGYQREYLLMGKFAASSLLHLLNDILDISRIEAGKLDLKHIGFSLNTVISSAIAPVKIEAEQKGIVISSTIADDVPSRLIGDPDRLRQVFLNLIRNAVKFTEKGTVSINVKQEGNDGKELMFSVKDTGIGIPKDKLEEIFEAFTQVDGSIRRKYGGTGLGLHICKKLVEMMGGNIWAESELCEGSTFYFTALFDLQEVEAQDAQPEKNTDTVKICSRPRILLVEDEPTNQKVLHNILEKEGCEVTVMPDGKMALEALNNKTFDLILMDVLMPEMDGLEATRLIRQRKDNVSSIPIVALTAKAFGDDRQHCLSAGMNDHIPKPVNRADLIGVIKKFLPCLQTSSIAETNTNVSPTAIFNPAYALTWQQGDIHRLKMGVNRFHKIFPLYIRQIKESFLSGSKLIIKEDARNLKNMASEIGADEIADEIFRFKLACRTGEIDKCRAALERIEKAYEKFKTALASFDWEGFREKRGSV